MPPLGGEAAEYLIMEEPVGGYSIATMRAFFAFQGSKTPACLCDQDA